MFIDLAEDFAKPKPDYKNSYSNWQTYVLELEDGKYYIGTSRNAKKRIRRHFKGRGAKWTRKYKPIRVVEIIEGGLTTEELTTLVYMREYGIENVRGSKWCHTRYPIPEEQVKELAQRIKILKNFDFDKIRNYA